MTVQELFKQVDKNEFIEHYSVNAYNTISFSTFCHKNNMPQIDELFDKLSITNVLSVGLYES